MIVYLSEHIHPVPRKLLEQHATIVDTFDDIEHIDAALLRNVPMRADLLKRAKNLKLVAEHGVGVDNIDLEAAKQYGIAVTNTPQANSTSVAEFVVGLIIALERNVVQADKALHAGLVKQPFPAEFEGYSLEGKTLGQIALGAIGSRVGTMLKTAFGMKVLAYAPHSSDEKIAGYGFTRADTLEEVIRNSDVVNVSISLNPETRDLVSGPVFDWFKPNAVLVNAARGGIVNEQDLYEALKAGKLRAAASDVFVQEPPAADHPLLSLPNFIAAPHIGGCTDEALRAMAQMAVDEILRLEKGELFKNRVV